MVLPAKNPHPLERWQVNLLRLTAFILPDVQIGEVNWWEVVVGETPEEQISKPKSRGWQHQGKLEPGKLALTIEQNRIDWRFSWIEEAPIPLTVPSLEVLGPFPDILQIFLRPMRQWLSLDTCPPIQRIAFGAVLLMPVDSNETGYRLLSEYLPEIGIDPVGSSDFLYQINRPRQTDLDLEDRRINRLSKWTCMNVQGTYIKITPVGIEQITGQNFFTCRLELDINTSATYKGELPRQLLSELFNGLIAQAEEIMSSGDIP